VCGGLRQKPNEGVVVERPVTVLVVAVCIFWSVPALAQDLETALSLESEGYLGRALQAFSETLERPGNSREDLITIYQHIAVLSFGTGDQAEARQALHRLLALDRDITLPESAPPELQELLEQAEDVWRDRSFDATVDLPDQVREGEGAVIGITVVDDVAGIVAGAVLLVDGMVILEESGRGPFSLTVEAASFEEGGVTITPRLLDEHGGTVWQGEEIDLEIGQQPLQDDQGAYEAGSSSDDERPRSGRGLRIAGWVLFGVSLALGGAGGALVAIDGRPIETITVDEGVRQRQYDTAIGGWSMVGASGAGLITSVILIALGYRNREREAQVIRLAWREPR
jgi:hypothetical protein